MEMLSLNTDLKDHGSHSLRSHDSSPQVTESEIQSCKVSGSIPELVSGSQPDKMSPKEQSHSTLKLPPCCVCGGKSSGFHFGVSSCEACKEFFRRYLQNKKDIYNCTKNGLCIITNKSRGNCSGCRLKKCLEVGMSKDASKLGRYTLTKRTKIILEVNKMEDSEIDPINVCVKNSEMSLPQNEQQSASIDQTCLLNHLNSADEIGDKSSKKYNPNQQSLAGCSINESMKNNCTVGQDLLQTLMEAMEDISPFGGEKLSLVAIQEKIKQHYELYKLKQKLFGTFKNIPPEEYYSVLKNHGLDLDGRWQCLQDCQQSLPKIITKYVHFAKLIPGFTNLPVEDQSILLKIGRFDFFTILSHEGYMEEYETFLLSTGTGCHIEEAADKFFSREYMISYAHIAVKWQRMKLCREEMALLLGVSLFFTDRCALKERIQVENIQILLLCMLQEFLKEKYKEKGLQRLSKMIDMFILSRDCSELFFKEYNGLCKNTMVVEEAPIVTDFFLEEW
ncbi:hypothetical protein CHS0354_030666 [Potamilus streckersoni]|uniref:Uncharacterized protein n=1 Tax=Potamilus streckersoni TaxID=2493646 RepID=A0AAE0SQP1_9BIVA|nr:hypothetical protein CHS0354_030666 [Potamilus streckersoni]